MWGQYLFELAEDYCESRNYKYKTLVTCVGKQPLSNVWVLSADVQINIDGQIIPVDELEYYW